MYNFRVTRGVVSLSCVKREFDNSTYAVMHDVGKEIITMKFDTVFDITLH